MEDTTTETNTIGEAAESVAQAGEAVVELSPMELLQAEVNKANEELTAAQTEAAKNKDGWLRSQAEFSNFRKRQETEMAILRQFATSGLIGKVLPVLDDFDRAMKNLPEALRGQTWTDGVGLIHRKLQLVLEGEQVKLIEAKLNDVFDPNLHEAVSHEDAPEGIVVDSGHVLEELQKGYKMGDRVLRPALVRVAK